jgi:hypothetical protein
LDLEEVTQDMLNAGEASDFCSPSLNLSFDIRSAPYYVKDNQNFIFQQLAGQTPFLQSLGVFDVYLSAGHSIEPHWHPNANEIIYMIQGEMIESVLNPCTLQVLSYRLRPQQTASMDNTHFTATFDNSNVGIIFGSDVLRMTPPAVFQAVYGVDARQLAEVLRPIDRTVIIGGS